MKETQSLRVTSMSILNMLKLNYPAEKMPTKVEICRFLKQNLKYSWKKANLKLNGKKNQDTENLRV